jgi:hypothetical protein
VLFSSIARVSCGVGGFTILFISCIYVNLNTLDVLELKPYLAQSALYSLPGLLMITAPWIDHDLHLNFQRELEH